MNDKISHQVTKPGSTSLTRHGLLLLLAVLILSGCTGPALMEMFMPFDFENDPNGDDSFATARQVIWEDDVAVVKGGISIDKANMLYTASFLPGREIVGIFLPPPSEVDIFSLGWLDTEDEISITHYSLVESLARATPLGQTEAVQAGLIPAFALVNADAEIVGGPAAAPVAIPTAGQYYLVVQTGVENAQVPFDYTLTIERNRSGGPNAPRPGALLLRFDGASGLGLIFPGDSVDQTIRVDELPAFDLSEARPDFAGQTERFKEMVKLLIEFIYADYNVLVTLDAPEAEAAGHYDTVVFTSVSGEDLGMSFTPLGIEPKLDVEDLDRQVGIIFIQSADAARLATDFNTFCAYWATVAAHEYGHAIGLAHTAQEAGGLMTPRICGAADTCTRRLKALTAAPLYGSEFVIQNPDIYLTRVLGRRDPQQAQAIRQRVQELFFE